MSATVVLLRGVNVGGHRTFRPAVLARELEHLGAVNIGAAGTFVIRQAIGRERLRAEIARRLPFEADIMMCDGREIVTLLSRDCFTGYPERKDLVRFVSVLSRRPRATPVLPMSLPASGAWMLRVLALDGRLAVGVYRRHMKSIAHLATLDRRLGVSVTTRSWSTVTAIAAVLNDR